MAKLKQAFELTTAFRSYSLDESLGEGGAGRVFGGRDDEGASVAVKILSASSSDKKRRFKNELGFLMRKRHPQIVPVTDYGLSEAKGFSGPFYVMPRFKGSLRSLMNAGLSAERAMSLFALILDGVDAAHLQGVTHRDLKPENILVGDVHELVVADFGIAQFTAEDLATVIETGPEQRLANFQYAAPEQRRPGTKAGPPADVYALGLMLNELFTGQVPHGTGYATAGAAHPELAFVDRAVAAMIVQSPDGRPANASAVRELLARYRQEFQSQQRLSALSKEVVKQGDIDDPLALSPPVLVGAGWHNGMLELTLDREVTRDWVTALHDMGNYTSMVGVEPHRFAFNGRTARASVEEHAAQMAINYFKQWLPLATARLRQLSEAAARQAQIRRQAELQNAKAEEERNLRVNQSLRI